MFQNVIRFGLLCAFASGAALGWAAESDPFRPLEGQTLAASAAPKTADPWRAKALQGPWPPDSTPFPNDGQVPQDVAVGDWNRDGRPDLAIAYAYADEVRWFLGGSGGGFISGGALPVGINPESRDDMPRRLWAADFDGDGFTDLAVLCSGVSSFNTEGRPPSAASFGILYGAPEGVPTSAVGAAWTHYE